MKHHDCCTIGGYTRIYNSLLPTFPYFMAYTASPPVVPAEYYNAKSVEERYLWLSCNVKKLIEYADLLAHNLNLADDQIEALYLQFEEFKNSGFDDYYADQVARWIDANLKYIFDHVVDQVFFGLTSDGHFCAYVPDSWSDIEFDTGYVYGEFDYGRLILRYNADGSGVIDNTGRYDDRYTDLERRVRHNENTLYTPMDQGGTV